MDFQVDFSVMFFCFDHWDAYEAIDPSNKRIISKVLRLDGSLDDRELGIAME